MNRLVWLVSVVFIICGVYRVNSQNVMTNGILDDMLINKVTDELLKFARVAIVEEGLDRVPTPDINETFKGPLHIAAKFTATNGKAGYLSTVQRTGNATISYHLFNATLKLDLGLNHFVIDYPIYRAKILRMGPSGRMQITIGDNSIYSTFKIHYGLHSCTQELEYLTMDKFENVKITLTGLRPFDWLLNKLVTCITKIFKLEIKYMIEDNIKIGIKSALKKYNICKYLPHF